MPIYYSQVNNYHLAQFSIMIGNLDKELFLVLWLVCYVKQNNFINNDDSLNIKRNTALKKFG